MVAGKTDQHKMNDTFRLLINNLKQIIEPWELGYLGIRVISKGLSKEVSSGS